MLEMLIDVVKIAAVMALVALVVLIRLWALSHGFTPPNWGEGKRFIKLFDDKQRGKK